MVTLLLAMASLASATNQWQASLETSSIQAGPASSLEAPLVIFESEWMLGKDALMPHDFVLTGQRVRVEMDRMEMQVHTSQSFHGVAGNTTTDLYDAATANGAENRQGYRLMVVPQGVGTDLRLRSQCGDIASSADDMVVRAPLAASSADRPPIEEDVADAIEWKDCGQQASLEVAGDFLVVLWNWDFEVQDVEATRSYQTGQLQHPALDGMPDVSGTISRDQEAWIHVTNGSLSLSLVESVPHSIYTAADAAVQSNSGFLLQDATGRLGLGDQAATGNDVHLQGSLDLTVVDNQHGQLATKVQGDLRGVYLDDAPLWQSTQIAAQSRDLWLMEFLVALGALAVLTFAMLPQAYYHSLQGAEARKVRGLPGASWRQRQSSAFTVMARNAYQQGRPRRALALARLASWFHGHPQAHIVRAQAYSELGRPQKVHAIHVQLDQLLEVSKRERCRNAWHAYQALRHSDGEAAFSWYQRARVYDPLEFRALAASPPATPSTRLVFANGS